uniref:Mpv17-like protein 2 n=1 Tax=Glossina brevipalpis TaxID=37001 RepID=A0A1A9W1G9_9MUSC
MLILLRSAWKSLARHNTVRVIRNLHNQAFSSKFLLFTNMGISCILGSAGDVLEQNYEIYEGELKRWNPIRTLHMGISGLSVGVVCHYWYQYLDNRLPNRTFKVVLQKIFLDQVVGSPIYIACFFITMGLLEKKSNQEILDEMREKAWKLYVAEWVVWPVAQFVNFYWLPTRYRVCSTTIPLSFSVIFDPGVRAVEIPVPPEEPEEVVEVTPLRDVPLFKLVVEEVAIWPPLDSKGGTFKLVPVDAESISIESMLIDDDEEPKFKPVVVVLGAFVVPTPCVTAVGAPTAPVVEFKTALIPGVIGLTTATGGLPCAKPLPRLALFSAPAPNNVEVLSLRFSGFGLRPVMLNNAVAALQPPSISNERFSKISVIPLLSASNSHLNLNSSLSNRLKYRSTNS